MRNLHGSYRASPVTDADDHISRQKYCFITLISNLLSKLVPVTTSQAQSQRVSEAHKQIGPADNSDLLDKTGTITMTGFFRPVTTNRQANNHCQYVDYSFIDTISLSNLLVLLVGPSLRWCILLLATTLDSRYRLRLRFWVLAYIRYRVSPSMSSVRDMAVVVI